MHESKDSGVEKQETGVGKLFYVGGKKMQLFLLCIRMKVTKNSLQNENLPLPSPLICASCEGLS